MSLLKLLFGRRREPTPPPPPPRGDSLTLTGAGLADADTSLPAVVTVTFGDRTFTATATRRGIGSPTEFALTDIHEVIAPAPEPVAPPPPPPPPPPAPVVVAEPSLRPRSCPRPSLEVVDAPRSSRRTSDEIAVVRRPITDGEGAVVGYELVAGGDGVRGTAGLLLDVFGDIGIDRLAGKHPAWVRIAPEFLLEVGTPPVRPDRVVLQIPAEPVTDEVLTALRRLQFSGYKLAIDGVEPTLLQICNAVKVPVSDRRRPRPRRAARPATSSSSPPRSRRLKSSPRPASSASRSSRATSSPSPTSPGAAGSAPAASHP